MLVLLLPGCIHTFGDIAASGSWNFSLNWVTMAPERTSPVINIWEYAIRRLDLLAMEAAGSTGAKLKATGIIILVNLFIAISSPLNRVDCFFTKIELKEI
jgi:hypothetical protein